MVELRTAREQSQSDRAEKAGISRQSVNALETAVPGNSNTGHDYGTDLSADQKRELVEYLKTL